MILSRLSYILIVLVFVLISCTTEKEVATPPFESDPVYVTSKHIVINSDTLSPVRLILKYDTLFVSYKNLPRIDLFDTSLTFIKTIPLTDQDNVYPTNFDVTDSLFVVVDHLKRMVILYDREGNLITSFGTLPDGITPLAPFSVIEYGGVAYISDISQHSILAISIVNAENITERGELILTIPIDTTKRFDLPTATFVTFDGRLLVADATLGRIHVFTCDGRAVYDFDPNPLGEIIIQGFSIDNAPDPSMQDSSSFDPSGVRNMGRFHAVDANNKLIHMYNSLGKFVGSYPDTAILAQPSSIAIDKASQKIFIADPGKAVVHVFEYEDGK